MEFSKSNGILDTILSVLPRSPFKDVVYQLGDPVVQQGLRYLNWFFPISEFLIVLGLWLSAISLYYIYIMVMRWIRLIN
jgi:hypothetical protein